MSRGEFQTKYHLIREIFNNAQIGDTPDCVYLVIPKDDVWDYLEKFLYHIRYEKDKDLEICFPCTIQECGLWGEKLKSPEDIRS